MEDVLIAAILQCRVAEAHIRLEAMRTLNLERYAKGESPAYSEEAMLGIIDEIGIGHNAVFNFIHESRL